MQQLDEIFGRKPMTNVPALAEPEAEPQLQIYVTHTHTDQFRLISIGRRSAFSVLPLLVHHIIGAIQEYAAGPRDV